MRDFLRKSVHVRPQGLFNVAVSVIITALFSVFTLYSPAAALTTTPQKINFQGRLTDASGNTTDGKVTAAIKDYMKDKEK